MEKKYVIGIDYGSDSCRAVLIDTRDGNEISSAVFNYPRWAEKKYCDSSKNIFRQHPLDYIEGLKFTVKKILEEAEEGASAFIKGISIDTTGSTPVAVNRYGVPLALTEGFEENPNAMFVLWKDHSSTKEAAKINKIAKTWGGKDYTKYSGGVYSSEWFWAKLLHILKEDEKVRKEIGSFVEHCDWIPALLTGVNDARDIKRSRCAAGHKAMWHEEFDGLPSEEFLIALDPILKGIREKLYRETYTAEVAAGNLCEEWANELGLPKSVVVGIGAFDAHMGAVGGQIKSNSLVKVMGTSTCDILMTPTEDVGDRTIHGICGQVNGSVVDGMLGMEAGQSAFGDIYAWFKNVISWPLETVDDIEGFEEIKDKIIENILPNLEKEARKLDTKEDEIIALDWMNGRRTPYANQELKGMIAGLSLGSDAPKIYKGLVESTAFGAKKIVDRFIDEGIAIDEVIAIGGVAKKSPFIMQTVADVLNMPVKVSKSTQTVALGAAIFAAKVSGVYETIGEAQIVMGSPMEKEYYPNPRKVEIYNKLYEKYNKLGTYIEFGK